MKILFSCVGIVLSACQNPAAAVSNEAPKALTTAPYRLEAGPFEVASVDEIVLRDATRGKDLSLTIRYPKGDGPFPVIVFSHGLGGAGKHYFPLTQHWATHGYVVLQPTHADSLSLRGEQDPDDERRPIEKMKAALEAPGAAKNRTKDVSFLIDSLGEIQKKVPQLAGKMDAEKIGVGGHSFGAHTTQLLAGAVHLHESHADARIKAFLLLSGQGSGRAGLSENSWDKIASPMMVMSGSLDTGAGGEGPQWRMEPYRRAPAGDKYSVFLDGATHSSFTGQYEEKPSNGSKRRIERRKRPVPEGTDQKKIFEAVKISTMAFWDAYLKAGAESKDYLRSGSFAEWGKPIVNFERK